MEGREVVIVEAVRTPVGRGHPEKGYFKDVHPNTLLGTTFVELFDRAGVDPSVVDSTHAEIEKLLEEMERRGLDAPFPDPRATREFSG